jgi:two-component system, cell cycle response regulator
VKQNPSILVVDDEQANTAQVSEILKQGGYNVATASDGFKALAACKVRLPDLILLDLYMPLMSGVDVYNRLRVEEKTKHIPVIFLKKKDEPGPALDKLQLEESTVLVKPVEPGDVTSLVKTVLREKFLKDELRKKEGQIRELTLSDPLTSFRNQRFLHEFLKTELAQCQRYDTPLSIVLVEPDQFRDILKGHGQKGTDSLLLQLAVILSRHNRKSDVLARTGNSEFTIVLTHTDKNGAVEVAERLRNIVAQSTFTLGETSLSVTVSLGISQFASQMDLDGSVLVSHARAALNQAKSSGGNMTLIAE